MSKSHQSKKHSVVRPSVVSGRKNATDIARPLKKSSLKSAASDQKFGIQAENVVQTTKDFTMTVKTTTTNKKRPENRSMLRILRAKIANLHLARPVLVAVYAVAVMLLIVVGTLVQNSAFGTVLIIIYGVIALLLGVRSGETTKMALVLFVYVILLTFAKNKSLALTFAQYAFLLLCFSLLSAARELWYENRTKTYEKAGHSENFK